MNSAWVLATLKIIKSWLPAWLAHFTYSNEDKQEQPNSEAFENTQLRLSDGSIIFTPNLFGPGISINDAVYKMASIDGGLKYHGFSLEGEYYLHWLEQFPRHQAHRTACDQILTTATSFRPQRW